MGELLEWRMVDASCPDCAERYELRYADVPTTGRIVRCHRCAGVYRVLRLGVLPLGVSVTREARCNRCFTPQALTSEAFECDDEVMCTSCTHRFRPSNGEGFLPADRGTGERITFGVRATTAAPPTPEAPAGGRHYAMLFGPPPATPRAPVPPNPARPLDPPQELVRCPACDTTYVVATQLLGQGASVQCTRCQAVFFARPANAVLADSTTAAPVALVPGDEPAPLRPREPVAGPFRSRNGFIGVTAARAARHLKEHGRRLPIDVWLTLADQLLAMLERVPDDAPVWRRWTGPFGFGIDLDGQFVAFDDVPKTRTFQQDWVHPTMGGMLTDAQQHRVLVWAVCRALVWLLDPFPTSMDGPNSRLERVFEHPQLPPALHAVLDAGLGLTGPPTLPVLRRALLESLQPAPMERVKAVLFALGFDTPSPDELEPRWRDGALQVHLDQLLERAEPIEHCPADPRAVLTTPFSMPLTPTRTLELTMRSGGRVIRRVPVTATLGFPQRIALPLGEAPLPAQRVELELRHPQQRALTVSLEGVVGTDGFVTPTIDTRTKGELDVLLASLDDEASAPAFVPPRPVQSEPEPIGPDSLIPHLVLAGLMGAGLGLVLLLVLLFSLPLVLLSALLVWLGVISTTTAWWVTGVGTGVILVLTVVHLLTRRSEPDW